MRIPSLSGLLSFISKARIRSASAIFRRFKSALTLARRLLAGRRHIIVVGGHNGENFDDNSRAMAIHLSSDPGYRVFWVNADKRRASVARHHITQLRKGSFYAELVASAAHCLLYSHGLSDVTLAPVSNTPWRKIIYLGHGVWGLKRIQRRSSEERKKNFDVTICVSSRERALKAEVLGCTENDVLPLGLPKHDSLIRDSTRRYRDPDRVRTVLYAPTWRDWLQHRPSDIALKLHFEALVQIACSMPECTPEGKEIRLVYLVHKNIRGISSAADDVAKEYGIKVVVSRNLDVNDLLKDVDYLISDYSALLWDFIVQKKPAALFPFDRVIYDKLTGDYPAIAGFAEGISFGDPENLWDFLLGPNAIRAAQRLADEVVTFSDGRSCERLAIAMDYLIRGEPYLRDADKILDGPKCNPVELATKSEVSGHAGGHE